MFKKDFFSLSFIFIKRRRKIKEKIIGIKFQAKSTTKKYNLDLYYDKLRKGFYILVFF